MQLKRENIRNRHEGRAITNVNELLRAAFFKTHLKSKRYLSDYSQSEGRVHLD